MEVIFMQIILLKAHWRYEDEPTIVGMFTPDKIEEAKNTYKFKFDECIRDSIKSFETETYNLNEVL
jgi:hypothetical protein